MDNKVLTYLLYLAITVPLTVFVARTLYRNGSMFLRDVFDGNTELAAAVNHLLVVGFYLLNLGYVGLFLRTEQQIGNTQEVIEVLTQRVGTVAIVLGIVHLGNVWVFNLLRRRAAEAQLPQTPTPTYPSQRAWGAPM